MPELVLRSRRVLIDGNLRPADVGILGELVAEVAAHGSLRRADDLGSAALLPGMVDAHVHVNDPGTDWEGFPSATSAAAAAGVVVLGDMPLNSLPVTTSPAALAAKAAAAGARCAVDVALYGGVVPENADPASLGALLDAGVPAIKAFLCDSGLPAFGAVTLDQLRRVAPLLARRAVPLLVHAELVDDEAPPPRGRRYADYLASRPPRFEQRAIEGLVALCRDSGCRVHVVHLANAEALPLLRAARREGLPLTVETCPHYLTFCAEEIDDGATLLKCAPPIRQRAHREGLWQGLREGTIDLVASDHSPCPAERKAAASGDFAAAWGGISSLELLFSAVWTEARARGVEVVDVVRWLSFAPRRLLGLPGVGAGGIAAGGRADLTVVELEREWTVDARALSHRHALTPYHGRTLAGLVARTYLRGELVFERGRGATLGTGRVIDRLADSR